MRTVDTRETVIVTVSGWTMTRISLLITFFRSGVPVSCKKKYIHTSKYSLINWFYFIALQLTVSCTLVHLEVLRTDFISNHFFSELV